MTNEERAIYTILKANPDYIHVNSDATALYVLVDGGMMCFTGADYSGMDDEELNLYIQEVMKKKLG